MRLSERPVEVLQLVGPLQNFAGGGLLGRRGGGELRRSCLHRPCRVSSTASAPFGCSSGRHSQHANTESDNAHVLMQKIGTMSSACCACITGCCVDDTCSCLQAAACAARAQGYPSPRLCSASRNARLVSRTTGERLGPDLCRVQAQIGALRWRGCRVRLSLHMDRCRQGLRAPRRHCHALTLPAAGGNLMPGTSDVSTQYGMRRD